MNESELIKEHIRYFQIIRNGSSAIPTFLLWATIDGAPKKATKEIWRGLDAQTKSTIKAFSED